ncbi:Asparagine synthetase [glutamine-hydrolyzing] [Thermogutta terrifontis]|uniref:asparagine synthase (glutamine-hydrolyzing) n=1 Tax=Thermogutta terrifontis TaxID=1331910 RepID=A0A286RD56_9BACT|nr:asparagine synthase (glutamine-hydrolyzing) [Thermogutta terrifontis]ASV73894.1 Asparagine synthetase [glutamine-hydrolyzing] [Thermogutta terrifontis]
MCGIAGAVWYDERKALSEADLGRMTHVLRHRGPDDEGFYVKHLAGGNQPECGVALGHRRLSIIDISGGHQPMCNEEETLWIVFNGEIYNFRSLRRNLEESGHRFTTRSDTEVLLHLYEEKGLDFLADVNGMFALALWDEPRRRLVLARDRLGEKPLVYRCEPDRLLFASELKALLEVPGIGREVDPEALDAYLLYQYVPYPWTIYRGIRKLPPGHFAVYENGQLKVRPYWVPDFSHEERPDWEDAVEQVRELLRRSVELRLEAEVPLGAFLSGGIDSTIVVGLMQQLATERVRTFSIGFPVVEYDETRYARIAAEAFHTDHREFCVEPDAIKILPRLVWHYDEPFADSSAIPTWYVAEMTRQHVTVALTGDGGDELFGGYPRYWAIALAEGIHGLPFWLRWVFHERLWRWASQARQKSFWGRVRRFTEALHLPVGERYLEWIAIFNSCRRWALYTPEFQDCLAMAHPERFFLDTYARVAGRDVISAISLADLFTYLPCDLLVKVDIAAMAHSLETRPPFLDHHLVEYAGKLPGAWKVRGRRGKRILLAAFKDLIPPAIQTRGKMGFGVPLDHWFRGPLAELARGLLLHPRTIRRGYFRREAVEKLLAEHQQGRWNHSYRIWALLFLELWIRRWIDGEESPDLEGFLTPASQTL